MRPAFAMLSAFRRLPVLTAAFAVAAALALVFLVNVVGRVIYWETHENEPIEPWMTVGYIGHSWDVNPRLLDQVAGTPTPQRSGHPPTLAEIARSWGVPVEEVIAQVEAALAELKARRHGDPGPEDSLHDLGRDAGP